MTRQGRLHDARTQKLLASHTAASGNMETHRHNTGVRSEEGDFREVTCIPERMILSIIALVNLRRRIWRQTGEDYIMKSFRNFTLHQINQGE
jgi:hypothetical protein